MINCLSLPAPLRGLLSVVSLTVIFQGHMALPHPISDTPAAPPLLHTKAQLSQNTKTLAENSKVRRKLREIRSVKNRTCFLPSVELVSHRSSIAAEGHQLHPEKGSLSKGTSHGCSAEQGPSSPWPEELGFLSLQ